MTSENPYKPPKEATSAPTASPKLLILSICAVFGSSLIGGALGLSVGAALGTIVPGYYRSVFTGGDSPSFDPVAVGIGQGLTQGVVFGGCIGLALVAMFYWHQTRKSQNQI